MLYYRIQSNVTINSGDAFLAVNHANQVVIDTYKSGNGKDHQLWQLVGVVDDGSTYRGLALVNKATGKAIYAADNDKAVTMIPFVGDTINRATWNIIGQAIQLHDNTAMNLNALGGAPYNSDRIVGAWSWGGGSANETWTWVQDLDA